MLLRHWLYSNYGAVRYAADPESVYSLPGITQARELYTLLVLAGGKPLRLVNGQLAGHDQIRDLYSGSNRHEACFWYERGTGLFKVHIGRLAELLRRAP